MNTDQNDSAKEAEEQAKAEALRRQQYFHIKTHVFEGPLDLLLNLIEKKKLFISDISLAKVTDDYISHINELPEYSLKHRAQFILIASTLLLIKAKSLLPQLELTADEETDIRDLELRLKIYELMRKYSGQIRERMGRQQIFERGDLENTLRIFAPGKDITGDALKMGIYSVINALPKNQIQPKAIIEKVVSLEEMMDNLAERIQSAMKMSFNDFSRSKSGSNNSARGTGRGTRMNVTDRAERVHVIVSFLAMLELVKQGSIEVKQDNLFDEIEMERNDVGIPRYA